MKTLTSIAASLALLYGSPALAEQQVIQVPGEGWHIRIDAPKLTTTPGTTSNIFSGRADRLQLSFFVEAPRCPGGDSNEIIYDCFAKEIRKSPVVVWETERANTTSNGVHVMYMTRTENDGKGGTAFNINVLFAHRGKWADVHGSVASPNKDDLLQLAAIMDSVTIVDDTPTKQLPLALTATVSDAPAHREPTRPNWSREALQSCATDAQLAKAAIDARKNGKSKEFMSSALPPRGTTSDPKTLLMYRVLDEVYGTPEIEGFPYFVYRFNICLRRHDGMPVPSPEIDMMKPVLSCQRQFGSDASNNLTDCIELATEDATKTVQPSQPTQHIPEHRP